MTENMTIKELKEFCKKQNNCIGCPYFYTYEDDPFMVKVGLKKQCIFTISLPCCWDIKEEN